MISGRSATAASPGSPRAAGHTVVAVEVPDAVILPDAIPMALRRLLKASALVAPPAGDTETVRTRNRYAGFLGSPWLVLAKDPRWLRRSGVGAGGDATPTSARP